MEKDGVLALALIHMINWLWKAAISQMPGIAAFSDDIRDALRGPFSDDKKTGFVGGIEGLEESLKAGIAGMIAHPQVDYSKVNYSKNRMLQSQHR